MLVALFANSVEIDPILRLLQKHFFGNVAVFLN